MVDRYYVFPKTKDRIERMLRWFERKENHRVDRPGATIPIEAAVAPTFFKNDAGETAPAFGVMAIKSSTVIDGSLTHVIEKPSTTFRRMFLVNNDIDVADGDYGVAQSGPFVRALYDNAATPALGEGWGPAPSSWKLKQKHPDVADIVGVYETDESVWCQWRGCITKIRGTTDAAVTAGNSVDVSVFDGGTPTDLGQTLSGVVVPYANLDNGAEVGCLFVNGRWEAYAAECPA